MNILEVSCHTEHEWRQKMKILSGLNGLPVWEKFLMAREMSWLNVKGIEI